jgi:uncharacterized RDD family membrane protein YckC
MRSTDMDQQFYIVIGGQQQGPFAITGLKEKGIQRDSLVWTEGMENWARAEDVPALRDILKTIPPPLPNTETSPIRHRPPPIPLIPPPSADTPAASTDSHFGYRLARRRERLLAAVLQEAVIISPFVLIALLVGEDLGDANFADAYTFGSIVCSAAFYAVLGAVFYSMWSGNLGHKIIGLKVISAVDGRDQKSAGLGALREALKLVFMLAWIPAMWLLWDDSRQNLYDKVVKTYVVKKKLGS